MPPDKPRARTLSDPRPRYAYCRCLSGVVGAFTVLGDVQAFLFRLRADPQADDQLDHEEDDRGADARPGDGQQDRLQLGHDLDGHVVGGRVAGRDVAIRRAGRVVDDASAAPFGVDQQAGGDGAHDAADRVDAEGVQAVVVLQGVFHGRAEEHADRADDQAQDQRADRSGEAGGRGDGHEAGDDARGHAQHRSLLARHPFHHDPAEAGGGGGHESVDHGQRGVGVGLKVGAGVEAEPAHPQEAGADHGQRQAVRRHRLLLEARALAQDDGADEGRDTGVDVHHGAASEVQRAPGPDLAGLDRIPMYSALI
eukprot:Opistho-2@57056